jgi:hypothetical protein
VPFSCGLFGRSADQSRAKAQPPRRVALDGCRVIRSRPCRLRQGRDPVLTVRPDGTGGSSREAPEGQGRRPQSRSARDGRPGHWLCRWPFWPMAGPLAAIGSSLMGEVPERRIALLLRPFWPLCQSVQGEGTAAPKGRPRRVPGDPVPALSASAGPGPGPDGQARRHGWVEPRSARRARP